MLKPFPAALAACLLAQPGWAADSHCSGQENTLFNCPAGKKLISVCASKDLDRSAGYLQYRFGPKNAPEIQVPPANSHPSGQVKQGALMFSGGGGAYLRFASAGHDYVVYTAVGRGWGIKEGVAVEKDGKRLAGIRCKAAAETRLGGEWFEKIGLPMDDKDFELP